MLFLYEHTQKTLWTILFLAIALIIHFTVLVAIFLMQGPDKAPVTVGLVSSITITAVMIVFRSLTVQLHPDYLKFYFGPGLFGKKIALTDITSCTTVKNRWWYGWGIRWIPNGWLYNIAGFDAIELILKTGKRVRIGTDQPAELAAAVNSALLSTA